MSGNYELYGPCRIDTNALEISKDCWPLGMRVDAGVNYNPTVLAQMYYDRFAVSGSEDRDLKFIGGRTNHSLLAVKVCP
jgi:hypothetical protein